MIVASVDPNSGRAISRAATSIDGRSLLSSASCNRRMRCSSITTASSTTSPTAAAMPPSVIMLKLMPSASSARQVAARTAGSNAAVITINRQLRRNRNSTSPASTAPSRIASRTDVAAPVTSSDWS